MRWLQRAIARLVLSGINLGRWGRDFQPQQKFEQLVRALLEYTGIEKIRISSVEPMDWSDELIALVAQFAADRQACACSAAIRQ